MIVGTSRAAQALQPSVMDDALLQSGYFPFCNFSFTIMDSPFGDLYYEAIVKKTTIREFDSRRVFLVCVDPFSLSMIKELDKDGYREDKGILRGLPFYSRPNFVYLVKYCKLRKWIKDSRRLLLHDDGWLEVSVRMDSLEIVKNKTEKLDIYRRYTAIPSKERIDGLMQTVLFFQTQGSVFLCRLSTCEEMNDIEESFWPDFDNEMDSIATSLKCPYFSFVNDFERYRTVDGNHIFKDDGALISKAICDSILLSSVDKNSRGHSSSMDSFNIIK